MHKQRPSQGKWAFHATHFRQLRTEFILDTFPAHADLSLQFECTREKPLMQTIRILLNYMLYAAISAVHALINALYRLAVKTMPAAQTVE